MKFEEVLPAYRAGKTITVPSVFDPKIIWRYPEAEPFGSFFRCESIFSNEWQIEPDPCSHCNGTGNKPKKPIRCPNKCDYCCNNYVNKNSPDPAPCIGFVGHNGGCSCVAVIP